MVTEEVYGEEIYRAILESNERVTEKLEHVSGQLDVLNHSLYVINEHLSWITVSIMLLAASAIFALGYMITRR